MNKSSKTPTHTNSSGFNPIPGRPYNIDKLTLEQVDNLKIHYIFTTGRSASTLLGVMLMMHPQIVFTSEEVFPIALKQKYQPITHWTKEIIQQYCEDIVWMSEGKLYPLFCGKEILYELLHKFKANLNYERAIRLTYLSFNSNKDLSQITTIIDKQLRYYLAHQYLNIFPKAKILLLVRDPRDNVYSKYNRAIRKKINIHPCLYIHTWVHAFDTYLKIIKTYQTPYLVINYEKLINDSVHTLQDISDFLQVPYTDQYFKYPEITKIFFETINHPQIKEHFYITHKSLTHPINPQKINEWQHNMHNKKIAKIIHATWKESEHIARQFNYQAHPEYQPQSISCWKTKLKIRYAHISSYIYFNIIPFFLKKIIKQLKYPQRKHMPTSYDKFLQTSYL